MRKFHGTTHFKEWVKPWVSHTKKAREREKPPPMRSFFSSLEITVPRAFKTQSVSGAGVSAAVGNFSFLGFCHSSSSLLLSPITKLRRRRRRRRKNWVLIGRTHLSLSLFAFLLEGPFSPPLYVSLQTHFSPFFSVFLVRSKKAEEKKRENACEVRTESCCCQRGIRQFQASLKSNSECMHPQK